MDPIDFVPDRLAPLEITRPATQRQNRTTTPETSVTHPLLPPCTSAQHFLPDEQQATQRSPSRDALPFYKRLQEMIDVTGVFATGTIAVRRIVDCRDTDSQRRHSEPAVAHSPDPQKLRQFLFKSPRRRCGVLTHRDHIKFPIRLQHPHIVEQKVTSTRPAVV